MADKTAIIAVDFDANGVVVGAKQVQNSLDDIKKKSEDTGNSSAQGFGKMSAALGRVAWSVGETINLIPKMNFAKSVDQVKYLDATAQRMAQTFGAAGDDVKKRFMDIEKATGVSASTVAQLASTLGDVTYDAAGSADAIEGLVKATKAWGADTNKALMWGETLRNNLGYVGDTTAALGKVEDIANRLGMVGGPTALLDTLSALGPQLGEISTESEEARTRLIALVAAAGKGLSPARAREAASMALGEVQSHSQDIERLLGRKITDDKTGKIVDPLAVLRDVQAASKAKWSDPDTRRRNMQFSFGTKLGDLLGRTDFAEAEATAQGARNQGSLGVAFGDYRRTKVGQREIRDLDTEAAGRDIAEKGLAVSDAAVAGLGAKGAAQTGRVAAYSKMAYDFANEIDPRAGKVVGLLGAGATAGVGIGHAVAEKGINVWEHMPKWLGGVDKAQPAAAAQATATSNKDVVAALEKQPKEIASAIAAELSKPTYRDTNQSGSW